MGRLFGTDGIRGIANEGLTCDSTLDIGRAVASVLSSNNRYRPVVIIGCDTRISSSMLVAAMTAGLCSMGADVIQVGVVPTPAVAFHIGKYKATAGVMISASHNPAEFNGIKVFNEDGYKLADDIEERIEAIVLDDEFKSSTVPAREVGTVRFVKSAAQDYIDHLFSTVQNCVDGIEIALDCSNGSASKTAEKLFEKMGAKAHILNNNPDGLNINKDCGSTHLEGLKAYVKEHKLAAGFAFDGDADRCLCVDEKGNTIDGDVIMAILALDMKSRGKLAKNTVVGTIMANFGFGKFCDANGIDFISTKVGDRYVLEEMLLEDYTFGGEQSGHIIFREFCSTGDGQLTAIQLLSYMGRSGKPLSELASVMKRYPQHIINIKASPEAKIAFHTNHDVKGELERAKAILGSDGRLVVRPSGTEPLIRVMAEGADEDETVRISEEVAKNLENILSVY
jgi:phosphoglucosamine mutase